MDSPHHGPLSGPLVSVILPVYNRPGWLARAVESVLSQTHGHLELLVVDDGSTDDTRRVLEGFVPRVRVLEHPHAGAESARNLGLGRARGEFVAFIDSDDVWLPDRLSRQLPLFRRPEVGLVFGDAALIDYRRQPPRRLKRTFFDRVRPSRGRVTQELARGCFIPFSSVLARRELLAEAGGFTPGRVAADYLKWVEVSAACEFDYVEGPVFEYAIHPGGISHELVETLEDRVEAFRELLARNTNTELDGVVRRILFNLNLSLNIARARRRFNSRSNVTARAPFSPAASARERLSWSLKFTRDQLLTRGRWWVLHSAAALYGRRPRP
ncbi:MAG TPA: glycosyltransferase family 2 protein [Pyrinomonadaceae bacterium]|nr:glycosyltransferase family 2 protein [Pyrinomonadaceae bacterium]